MQSCRDQIQITLNVDASALLIHNAPVQPVLVFEAIYRTGSIGKKV